MPTSEACLCASCRRACSFNPGWFLPGEAEKAAEHLGLTLAEFFDQKLGVNWWEADENTDTPIFVLAPALVSMKPGTEYPGDPRGRCVFLMDNGLCEIHPVKPFECAQFLHSDPGDVVETRHWSIAQAWQTKQMQIEDLLGGPPQTSPFGILDFLHRWGDW